jgi:glycosyltransferase involved in cell wall biosynthesis
MGRFLRLLIAGRESALIGLCAAGEADPSLQLLATGPAFYPLWEQGWLPWLVLRERLQILICPYNTAPLLLPRRVKLVLVVHDLIFLDTLPKSTSRYQNLGRFYRRQIVPRAIERADQLITVSHYTRLQLTSRFPKCADKVRVIPNSVEEAWFDGRPAVRRSEPYILAVAGEAPSKNLARAIAAFARLRQLSGGTVHRFRIAGVKPQFHASFRTQAQSCGVGEWVELLDYLSEDTMRALFRRAELFLMPSLFEGFGIPVLEAMASGVPVVCSSGSCLPEIAGNAAFYFDPTSVDQMASAMHAVLADSKLQAEMSRLGLQQAERYHPRSVRSQVENFWTALSSDMRSL